MEYTNENRETNKEIRNNYLERNRKQAYNINTPGKENKNKRQSNLWTANPLKIFALYTLHTVPNAFKVRQSICCKQHSAHLILPSSTSHSIYFTSHHEQRCTCNKSQSSVTSIRFSPTHNALSQKVTSRNISGNCWIFQKKCHARLQFQKSPWDHVRNYTLW